MTEVNSALKCDHQLKAGEKEKTINMEINCNCNYKNCMNCSNKQANTMAFINIWKGLYKDTTKKHKVL